MQTVLKLPPGKYILRIPIFSEVRIIRTFPHVSYRGADKSLARPERKQSKLLLDLQEKNLDGNSHLDFVEIVRVPEMLPSFFSFPVGLRSYQHPEIYVLDTQITELV